jgi:hypothetical protein
MFWIQWTIKIFFEYSTLESQPPMHGTTKKGLLRDHTYRECARKSEKYQGWT